MPSALQRRGSGNRLPPATEARLPTAPWARELETCHQHDPSCLLEKAHVATKTITAVALRAQRGLYLVNLPYKLPLWPENENI